MSHIYNKPFVVAVYVILIHVRVYLKTINGIYFFIWFVRLLALRPLLTYCASLG
jgi:hypothetical protein